MYLPNLLALLVSIVREKANKPLMCMIASMVLKHWFHALSPVQGSHLSFAVWELST